MSGALYTLKTGLLRRRDTFRLSLTLKTDISACIVLEKKYSVFRILSTISDASLKLHLFDKPHPQRRKMRNIACTGFWKVNLVGDVCLRNFRLPQQCLECLSLLGYCAPQVGNFFTEFLGQPVGPIFKDQGVMQHVPPTALEGRKPQTSTWINKKEIRSKHITIEHNFITYSYSYTSLALQQQNCKCKRPVRIVAQGYIVSHDVHRIHTV